jgi:hypothetical protein
VLFTLHGMTCGNFETVLMGKFSENSWSVDGC